MTKDLYDKLMVFGNDREPFLAHNFMRTTDLDDGTATVTLAIICMVLSCFPSLTELLVNLGSVSAAITIVIVCASLICARKKVPHQAGSYKAPGGNFISVLTIVLIVASYIPGIFSGGGTMWLFTIIIYAVGAVIMAYYLKKKD